jgi:hypothetical protein
MGVKTAPHPKGGHVSVSSKAHSFTWNLCAFKDSNNSLQIEKEKQNASRNSIP